MSEQLPTEKLAKFCETLGVQPSYQDSQASRKLQQRLKELDSETLLTLISDGAEICCQIIETIESLTDRDNHWFGESNREEFSRGSN
jgi:hypothetical protein